MSAPMLDEHRFSVLLDIRQPQAYLALGPAARMAADRGIAVDWLPIAVEPLRPPSAPRDGDDRGVRHRRFRALAIAREIETYARVEGLVIENYYRDDDPTTLHVAWLWLREQHPDRLLPFLTEAFRAFWARELDITSDDALASLLSGTAADRGDFDAYRRGDGSRDAATLAEDLRGRGLARSPCYVVNGEVFVGRQHLRMIGWILDGRSGRGPI